MSLKDAFIAFFKALKKPNVIETKKLEEADASHLKILALLQKQGRLIDFFKEDLTGLSDAQIGSAVRKIHDDCQKSLEEYVALRPVLEHEEGSKITIPKGYDISQIKIVGKVKGEAPYVGVLRHKGWKAEKLSLPPSSLKGDKSILCPAEVEV